MNALPLPESVRPFRDMVSAFEPIAQESAASIRNLTTHVEFIGQGAWRVPVTVNSSEPGNAWVCSPHTAYVRYAIEEADRALPLPLRWPVGTVCRAVGGYLWRAGIDDAVTLNHWMLSTNIYPSFELGPVRDWCDEALARWPRHALWFRSLNARHTAEWMRQLGSALGFRLVPSRQVYLYDWDDRAASNATDRKRDERLRRAAESRCSDAAQWSMSDFDRAAELYGMLYLQKYSRLNVDYSARFLRLWHAAGLLTLSGYRNERGTLEAILGLHCLDNTVTAPIVGYDTGQPQQKGLYRVLMATAFDFAQRNRLQLNLSAGAAGFKRQRGGMATMEYSAVHAASLRPRQARAIRVLERLASGIGVPLMERLEL